MNCSRGREVERKESTVNSRYEGDGNSNGRKTAGEQALRWQNEMNLALEGQTDRQRKGRGWCVLAVLE